MFKNPLKYQQGGSAPTQQQQEQLIQLFQAAAKNAQVDLEALVQKAQKLGQDENAAAQFMEGLQRCAQGDPDGIRFIKSLFTQSAKRGGKIQDFICKHARGGQVAGCGCGGSVKKAQGGTEMPYTRGSYQPSDYHNYTGTWIETPSGVAQNYRPYAFGGRTWGWGGNDLEQVLVVPGENGTPRRAVRRISNWFNPDVPTERLDTTYQDANRNTRNSRAFEERVNRELEGVSGSRPTSKQGGGNIEKLPPLYEGWGAEEEVTYPMTGRNTGWTGHSGKTAIVNGRHVWIPNSDYEGTGSEYKEGHGYPITDGGEITSGRVMTPEELEFARKRANPQVTSEKEYIHRRPVYIGEIAPAHVSAPRAK